MKTIWSFLLIIGLTLGLVACGDRQPSFSLSQTEPVAQTVRGAKLAEVAPPAVIEELRQSLEQYQPQVKILSPKPEQVLSDTTVKVKIQVRDLPLFKAPELEMGPHLHLFLDNEPYRAIYSVEQPVVLEDVSPGTHTLRVFASRPWHESFKNEGAYAQTTFHVLTKTGDNTPDPSLPLLTYSRPQGSYGAEPIMLDFYLTNAPLHLAAQENPEDEIADWRIRVTINGESFLLDNWQAIYLKGFEPGKNWVQLEFLDEQGNRLNNAFNNTVRLITYQPQGQDTLSKIVRGELSAAQVRAIVERNARFEPVPEPTTAPTEAKEPEIEAEIPAKEGIEPEESSREKVPLVEPQPSVEEAIESKSEEPTLEEITAAESAIPPQKLTESELPAEAEIPAAETENLPKETTIIPETLKVEPPTAQETPPAETESSTEQIMIEQPQEKGSLPEVEIPPPEPAPSQPAKLPQWLENILSRFQRFSDRQK